MKKFIRFGKHILNIKRVDSVQVFPHHSGIWAIKAMADDGDTILEESGKEAEIIAIRDQVDAAIVTHVLRPNPDLEKSHAQADQFSVRMR